MPPLHPRESEELLLRDSLILFKSRFIPNKFRNMIFVPRKINLAMFFNIIFFQSLYFFIDNIILCSYSSKKQTSFLKILGSTRNERDY